VDCKRFIPQIVMYVFSTEQFPCYASLCINEEWDSEQRLYFDNKRKK